MAWSLAACLEDVGANAVLSFSEPLEVGGEVVKAHVALEAVAHEKPYRDIRHVCRGRKGAVGVAEDVWVTARIVPLLLPIGGGDRQVRALNAV